MVYFGGNDGALHGVSACTGAERLAFVPNTVYPNLSKLTSLDYSHQYYVDGPSTVVDAYFANATIPAWHSVLVGTLRGGGKSVFALDVTDPNDFSEANASNIVLWEIRSHVCMDGDSSPDYAELGLHVQPAGGDQGRGAWLGGGVRQWLSRCLWQGGALSRRHRERLDLVASIDLSAVDATAHGAGKRKHGLSNGLHRVSDRYRR